MSIDDPILAAIQALGERFASVESRLATLESHPESSPTPDQPPPEPSAMRQAFQERMGAVAAPQQPLPAAETTPLGAGWDQPNGWIQPAINTEVDRGQGHQLTDQQIPRLFEKEVMMKKRMARFEALR